ncbi:MAG: porphobilinogen synthase [Planctomycetota bacterium]|nr:porphobilinogen synthase [Planctomycetota bacterium]MCX8040082.1 porphobilinogen synthase [Planctomycetota bacterium]
MIQRPRRNRVSAGVRALVREHELSPAHLVWPVFVHDGPGCTAIAAMPGCQRLDVPALLDAAREALAAGIRALALFPVIPAARKDPQGSAALDPEGILPRAIRSLKQAFPELVVITDVALDPYSSDGHDGLVIEGRIANDATLPILAQMAVLHARCGADVVAPSDMMDGRVAAIRQALDSAGFSETLICSYTAKYASSFYGPFREALDSAPRFGDKRSYQMDPANAREAEREAALDEAEGADWLLVKPGLPYLDIIARLRTHTCLPIAAYQVSGEYAMLKAAARNGWIDERACLLESLLAFRRAGADIIFTYAALEAARWLRA